MTRLAAIGQLSEAIAMSYAREAIQITTVGSMGEVLVAHTDVEVCRRVRWAFMVCGYEVRTTAAGAEVLDVLGDVLDGRIRAPSLMLLGAALPGYSGLGILAAMRGIRVEIPTVIIARDGDQGVVDSAIRLGACRVLRWPFDLDQVLDLATSAPVGLAG